MDGQSRLSNRTDSVYNQIYFIAQFLLLIVLSPLLMGLIRTVFSQIITHIILLLLLMRFAYLMLLLPTKYSRMPQFYGIYTICYFPFYISYGTPFFLHVLLDRIYRKEVLKIVDRILSFCPRSSTHFFCYFLIVILDCVAWRGKESRTVQFARNKNMRKMLYSQKE